MTKHLIYHIMPMRINDVWRYNLRRLSQFMNLFDGKRYITVVQDDGQHLHSVQEVQREAGFSADLWQAVPLDRNVRDSIALKTSLPLLQHEEGYTFHAHTKGVFSVGNQLGIMRWRNAMYEVLLGQYQLVRQVLRHKPVCGTYFTTKINPEFVDGHIAPWHFQGSFYWFRNQDVFSRDWQTALESGGAWLAEYFLPLLFQEKEAGWLGPRDMPNPYDPNANHPMALPDETEQQTTIDTYLVKVNLGSGEDLREGWINVDLDGLADVQCDLAAVGRGEARLPFEDGSVDRILCSHTLEHIYPYHGLLHEMCRVSRLPGFVEIVVPHYHDQMAMCQGHLHTVSPMQVYHWTESAVPYWFGGQSKRLRLFGYQFVPSAMFDRAQQLFPQFTTEDLFNFVPNTCHEVRYMFYVISNKISANRKVVLNPR